MSVTAARKEDTCAPPPKLVTMSGAINRALRDAMTADADVVVFGEDVGALGGVFRVTDGISRDFGQDQGSGHGVCSVVALRWLACMFVAGGVCLCALCAL